MNISVTQADIAQATEEVANGGRTHCMVAVALKRHGFTNVSVGFSFASAAEWPGQVTLPDAVTERIYAFMVSVALPNAPTVEPFAFSVPEPQAVPA